MARNEKEKKQKAKKTPHWFCTIYDDDDDILFKSSSSRIDSVSQIILSCSTYMCVCVCHNTQAFFMDKRWTVFYITIMFTRHTHTHTSNEFLKAPFLVFFLSENVGILSLRMYDPFIILLWFGSPNKEKKLVHHPSMMMMIIIEIIILHDEW